MDDELEILTREEEYAVLRAMDTPLIRCRLHQDGITYDCTRRYEGRWLMLIMRGRLAGRPQTQFINFRRV